jgi:hypothetical protein
MAKCYWSYMSRNVGAVSCEDVGPALFPTSFIEINIDFKYHVTVSLNYKLILFIILIESLAKNLEQSEVKDWLESTKETLMGDR